jgi:hypothetical protein
MLLEQHDDNSKQHRITAPLDPRNNVASIYVHMTGAGDDLVIASLKQ